MLIQQKQFKKLFDVVEVHDNNIWGKQCANSTKKFNAGPVSAVRPSTVTNN